MQFIKDAVKFYNDDKTSGDGQGRSTLRTFYVSQNFFVRTALQKSWKFLWDGILYIARTGRDDPPNVSKVK